MTDKKPFHDEKLIEELYEKLWWYTYEATDEEFNTKEVDAIVRLLEVLEPIKEDQTYEPGADAAYERFQKRYGAELAHMADLDEDAEEGEEAEASQTSFSDPPLEILSEKEEAPEKKREEPGRASKSRKILLRIAATAAACLVLVVSLNMGTYALQRKSFFEIIEERIGKTKVIVTGNEEIEENTSGDIACETWEEVEEILGEKVLRVNYIPDGYVLEEMTVGLMQEKDKVFVKYCNGDKFFVIGIYIYPVNYSRNMMAYDEDWELIKEDTEGKKAGYYAKGDVFEAVFFYNKGIYYVSSNEKLDVLEKVVNGME